MQIVTDPVALTTTGGIAAVVGVVLHFVVKTRLRLFYGLPLGGGEEDPVAKAKYSWALNIIALLLGVALSMIALFVLESSIDGRMILGGVLNGLFGGLSAIGLSETASNMTGRP